MTDDGSIVGEAILFLDNNALNIGRIFIAPEHFLWAVQWHPEFSYKTDENSRRIFSAFVEAMKR